MLSLASRFVYAVPESTNLSIVLKSSRRRRRSLCRLSNVKEEPHALAALVIILHDTRHLQETTVQTGQETGIDQKTGTAIAIFLHATLHNQNQSALPAKALKFPIGQASARLRPMRLEHAAHVILPADQTPTNCSLTILHAGLQIHSLTHKLQAL